MRNIIMLVLLITNFFHCSIYNDDYRRWKIEPGQQLSRPLVDIKNRVSKNLTFRFKINDNCNSYTSNCPEQINKLIGISDRPFVKNDRSVILGWSTDSIGQLKFHNFVNYNVGNFKSEFIMYGETNKWYDCSIIKIDNNYEIHIDGNIAVLKAPKFTNRFLYLVDPYFGGRCPNPSNDYCLIWVEFYQ